MSDQRKGKRSRPVGTKISFLIDTTFGSVRCYAIKYQGDQLIHFGADPSKDRAVTERHDEIACLIAMASLRCPGVKTVKENGTKESEALPDCQVFLKDVHFVDEFAESWGCALKNAKLNPQDGRVEPMHSAIVTKGQVLQKAIDMFSEGGRNE